VDKDVFFSVVSVYESVSRLYVKPFNGAADFGGNNLLGWFLLRLLLLDLSLLVISSLLMGGLGLRVSHDVRAVLMLTYDGRGQEFSWKDSRQLGI